MSLSHFMSCNSKSGPGRVLLALIIVITAASSTWADTSMQGIVEGRMRRISVRLGQCDYSEAIRAHDGRLKVKCTGDLTKEGRGNRLANPRRFEVVVEE